MSYMTDNDPNDASQELDVAAFIGEGEESTSASSAPAREPSRGPSRGPRRSGGPPRRNYHRADQQGGAPGPSRGSYQRRESRPSYGAPQGETPQPADEATLQERLKDDLKISYEAKGVLDITVGGYGFL